MIRALGGLLIVLAAIVAFSTRPLTRESRIVIDHQPLWKLPTPFGWAVIFFVLIGLTAAALTLFPTLLRRSA